MRKGQIEIMGLVIIVILIVFIAIFSLSFFIKPKQDSEDILKLKANALRSSVLKTSVCGGVSIKDEIENCMDGYPQCLDCNNLKIEIVKIIESSLEGENYSFVVEGFMDEDHCENKITSVSQDIRNSMVEVALCRR